MSIVCLLLTLNDHCWRDESRINSYTQSNNLIMTFKVISCKSFNRARKRCKISNSRSLFRPVAKGCWDSEDPSPDSKRLTNHTSCSEYCFFDVSFFAFVCGTMRLRCLNFEKFHGQPLPAPTQPCAPDVGTSVN